MKNNRLRYLADVHGGVSQKKFTKPAENLKSIERN